MIEPDREAAKAELQAAMDRTAEACCSADSPGSHSSHADILLRVRNPPSTSALIDAAPLKGTASLTRTVQSLTRTVQQCYRVLLPAGERAQFPDPPRHALRPLRVLCRDAVQPQLQGGPGL